VSPGKNREEMPEEAQPARRLTKSTRINRLISSRGAPLATHNPPYFKLSSEFRKSKSGKAKWPRPSAFPLN